MGAKPYTGGCACGAVRYEVNAAPTYQGHCQCRKCQHMTGTGHSSMMAFPRAAAKVTGKVSSWDYTADSGQVTRRNFCPVCGSPVFSLSAVRDDIIVFNAAGMDEPARFAPSAVVYTEAGHPWDHVDPGLPRFATMPPLHPEKDR